MSTQMFTFYAKEMRENEKSFLLFALLKSFSLKKFVSFSVSMLLKKIKNLCFFSLDRLFYSLSLSPFSHCHGALSSINNWEIFFLYLWDKKNSTDFFTTTFFDNLIY